ncbi:MAG: sigma 54-interacting transcriptional regulator [Candidatus Hinthialibacter sp.]
MKQDLSRFGILGESEPMRELADWTHAAAPHWDTILITGERGTGKELLAQAIHRLGPTRGAELVIVDCAALHPAMAEAALFGHERGAFTGALNRRIGYLEAAHEGSVFLDEIGSLPLETQGRLLRFLESRTLTRIGAVKPLKIRTRIIAATNRDIHSDCRNGRFLPDLYDRLCVLQVRTPPLRERCGDIPILIQHFMGEDNFHRLGRNVLQILERYSYPGNIRELRNLSRRLTVFYPEGRIQLRRIHRIAPEIKNQVDRRAACSAQRQEGITAAID